MDAIEHPDIARVRGKLQTCKGYWAWVAANSGVSYSWLSKFACGHVKNPGANTLQRVSLACDRLIDFGLCSLPGEQQPHHDGAEDGKSLAAHGMEDVDAGVVE